MDFPIFFLDGMGTRLLIGIIAGMHVLINHPLAVGIYPLLVLIEYVALKKNWPALDEVARKITFVVFIITTTVGALSGVGIWLSTSLAAPFAIGSLLRVFFWGWFVEWLVFISEVILIMIYFLTWKRWREGRLKILHMRFGIALAVMSWLTMALIVAILAFMMDSGGWTQNKNFFSAFFNPLYIPQLIFRTFYALMAAGFFALFCTFFFTKKGTEERRTMVTTCSGWALFSGLACLFGGIVYMAFIPPAMKAQIDVGLLTMQFAQWQDKFNVLLFVTCVAFVVIGFWGFLEPKHLPQLAMVLPLFLSVWLLGHFERVREFIRKPYVIADYMYSNGFRPDELEFFQYNGILKYATYARHSEVTEDNLIDAGEDVFMLTCSRCHTTGGINGVLNKFTAMYGTGAWDPAAMKAFMSTMHNSRKFMPPFPGNDQEKEALVAYILDLKENPRPLPGAQSAGIALNPLQVRQVVKLSEQKHKSLSQAERIRSTQN